MENTLFVCECSDPQHQLIVSHDPDPAWNEVIYIHVHLAPKPFWQRIKIGLLYIFGRRSAFGAFDEVLLNKQTAIKLTDTLSKHIEAMK